MIHSLRGDKSVYSNIVYSGTCAVVYSRGKAYKVHLCAHKTVNYDSHEYILLAPTMQFCIVLNNAIYTGTHILRQRGATAVFIEPN